MNLQYLKDSKAVAFAVGITAIGILAWWMFTGDLPLLADRVSNPPAETQDESGNVQAPAPVAPLVVSMLVQGVIWVGASIIGLLTGIWSAIAKALSPAPTSVAATAVQAQSFTVQQPNPPESLHSVDLAPDQMREAVIDLGRAAARSRRQSEEVEKGIARVRKPVAIQELRDALTKGDQELATELWAELSDMLWPEPVQVTETDPVSKPAPKHKGSTK